MSPGDAPYSFEKPLNISTVVKNVKPRLAPYISFFFRNLGPI